MTDTAHRISKLKRQWAGNVCRLNADGSDLFWSDDQSKRSVGRPAAIWTDERSDLREVAGSSWMRPGYEF